MRVVSGQKMRETPSRGGRRLEAAVTPARIEIETLDGRVVDNGRSIRRHVHDAPPTAQQPRLGATTPPYAERVDKTRAHNETAK